MEEGDAISEDEQWTIYSHVSILRSKARAISSMDLLVLRVGVCREAKASPDYIPEYSYWTVCVSLVSAIPFNH